MEGTGGPWWPEAVETNMFPTDSLYLFCFFLTKQFIIIKEAFLGCKEFLFCDETLLKIYIFSKTNTSCLYLVIV